MIRTILAPLFFALALATGGNAMAKQTCYDPGLNPAFEANHDVAAILGDRVGAVIIPAGTVLKTDQAGDATLRTMPPTCDDIVMLIDVEAAEANGSFDEGYITDCHNHSTFAPIAYNPTNLVEVPAIDLYVARALRDVSETWFHTIIAAADWCAGGNLRIYPGLREPEWTPAPMSEQQARSSSGLVAALGETRALNPTEATAPSNNADYKRERWDKLTRCPEAGKANWVVDWLTGECRAPKTLAETYVAITGEKLAEFDNKEQYDAMEAYLLRAGVLMRGSVNNGTYREYIFPDVCVPPPTIAETYAAGQAAFDAAYNGVGGYFGAIGGVGARFGGTACDTCEGAVAGLGIVRGGIRAGNSTAAFTFGPRFGTDYMGNDPLAMGLSLGVDAGGRFLVSRPVGYSLRAVFDTRLSRGVDGFMVSNYAIGGEFEVLFKGRAHKALPAVGVWVGGYADLFNSSHDGATMIHQAAKVQGGFTFLWDSFASHKKAAAQ